MEFLVILQVLSVAVMDPAVRVDLPLLCPVEQVAAIVHKTVSWESVIINSPRINRAVLGFKMEK
jgi:hypothetical protein